MSTFAPPEIIDIAPPSEVVIAGDDARRMRPEVMVEVGQIVQAFQCLAADKSRPWRALYAPVAGRIDAVERGAGRRIDRIALTRVPLDLTGPSVGLTVGPDLPRRMVQSGLWPMVTARPYGGIADPAVAPRHLIVKGWLSDPRAPQIDRVLSDGDRRGLVDGLRLLAGLAPTATTLVHDGADPTQGASIDGLGRRNMGRGPRSSGAWVDRLGPAQSDAPVWIVDWQDAVQLGLRAQGHSAALTRLLTVATDGTKDIRLVRCIVGTPLSAVSEAIAPAGGVVLIGEPARRHSALSIGRHDDRLTVTDHIAPRTAPRRRWPVLPTRTLESALPWHPAPAALLRALATGDDAAAIRLGALDLGSDDIAPCRDACGSGVDYLRAHRALLERLAEEAEQ